MITPSALFWKANFHKVIAGIVQDAGQRSRLNEDKRFRLFPGKSRRL
ncbi:hypothetical protein HMPREF1986_02856 [Oribacterium sp. oral taxon 078 str. F0263]|nr:hypothetical protein HMPREF1986_02856 [Oribacterium sp. oral taxon 078 str. F0263]